MAESITRVLAVDDYQPWHSFYKRALAKQANLQVVGCVSDGSEAVQQAQELQPHLILLDIGLPKLNGIEAAHRIREVSPMSKILFISENRSPEVIEKALSDGANGYVVKSDAARDLLLAVVAVLAGKRFVSPSVAGQVLATSSTKTPQGSRPTDRNPYLEFAGSASISEFLASIIAGTAADFGVVQLFDSTNRVLRIVAQQGFESEFMDRLNAMGRVHSACNKSMNERSRIIVTDVATDPIFSDDLRDLLLQSNVRSIQSTPLIDLSGNFVGVVSTHCSHPGTPSLDDLMHIDKLATSFVTETTSQAST